MIDLDQFKVTPRDQQVLNLLVQGCSNKEIAGQLNISPRTVKQHLRTLFLRAGIREGRKRVKLAIAMFTKEGGAIMTPRERLTPKEIQIAILVWEGLTNREIGKIVGTSEQVIKNHLRSAFDKLGVWSRLELAMYVAEPRREGLAFGVRTSRFLLLKPLGPISWLCRGQPAQVRRACISSCRTHCALHTPAAEARRASAILVALDRASPILCKTFHDPGPRFRNP